MAIATTIVANREKNGLEGVKSDEAVALKRLDEHEDNRGDECDVGQSGEEIVFGPDRGRSRQALRQRGCGPQACLHAGLRQAYLHPDRGSTFCGRSLDKKRHRRAFRRDIADMRQA